MHNVITGQLGKVCKGLLEYDPEIVEIVQFGSSVYAPKYARDVDLLVITRKVKDYGGYLDATNPEDASFDVDVIVFEVDNKPREDLMRNILGAFEILYGDGSYVLKYAKDFGDPTFDEAKSSLRVASSIMKIAIETENRIDRDRLIREAFDALFHASRIASMVFLSNEIGRWGLIRRRLPKKYGGEFEAFIDTLHMKYFYNGDYPKESVEDEFKIWLSKVQNYVERLEEESRKVK
ncbi:MAG: hypothetical protein ACUVTL_02030 [Thermoproteota archaeon]